MSARGLHVDLPGRPFDALMTGDGSAILVSLTPSEPAEAGGVAVLGRHATGYRLRHVVESGDEPPLWADAPRVAGLAPARGDRLLVVACAERILIFDVADVLARPDAVPRATLPLPPGSLALHACLADDDRMLFVTVEGAVDGIAVFRLDENGGPESIGWIPAGIAPVSMALSPDGRLLYATCARADPEWDWPSVCSPEGEPEGSPVPCGAVLVIDVARGARSPETAVIARIPVGCVPVRLRLTRDGRLLWVTLRGEDAVVVLDTGRLLDDPDAAVRGRVAVGPAPIGLELSADERLLLVANSHRFRSGGSPTISIVDTERALADGRAIAGTLPAGELPREMRRSPDGSVILVANHRSKTLQIVALGGLP